MESAVGYVATEDVYIAYSEYYGDGTIYGRVDLLLNGEPVKGAGKSKKELVEAGVVLSETVVGSINGELVSISDSNESVPEVVEVVPEEVVNEVVEEVVSPNSGMYTVSIVIAGFTVTRELNVKINEESRQIYLSE
jgi:hypothetical protein